MQSVFWDWTTRKQIVISPCNRSIMLFLFVLINGIFGSFELGNMWCDPNPVSTSAWRSAFRSVCRNSPTRHAKRPLRRNATPDCNQTFGIVCGETTIFVWHHCHCLWRNYHTNKPLTMFVEKLSTSLQSLTPGSLVSTIKRTLDSHSEKRGPRKSRRSSKRW